PRSCGLRANGLISSTDPSPLEDLRQLGFCFPWLPRLVHIAQLVGAGGLEGAVPASAGRRKSEPPPETDMDPTRYTSIETNARIGFFLAITLDSRRCQDAIAKNEVTA